MHNNPTEFAAALRAEPFRLSKTFAWALANGQRAPSLSLAVKIQRNLGIPCDYWVSKEQPTTNGEANSGRLIGEAAEPAEAAQ